MWCDASYPKGLVKNDSNASHYKTLNAVNLRFQRYHTLKAIQKSMYNYRVEYSNFSFGFWIFFFGTTTGDSRNRRPARLWK